MALPLDFTGKTIAVVGCHKGGMGGATCRQLAKGGATVVAVDNQQSYLDEIAAEVRDLGATCHTLTADLMDIAECEKLIPRILDEVGAIDGLVCVAGGTRGEEWMPLDETPGDSFWKTIQLNFAYVFYLCRDAAKFWIDNDRKGAIVNIGSVSAKDAAPWHGPYGAGKSGIIALTRTMANEWHEFGIRANSVSPGAVASERVALKAETMSQATKDGRDTSEEVIFCQPEQLANGIVFLLSDLASGISGQNLTVDRTLSTKFCASPRKTRAQMRQAQ
ncbi:MAG: SDR family NAD(P)-dependent oxidoreductase [Novosphingobium sp.]